MKEVKVGKSKIHGKGLFSNEPIKKGDLITKVHAAVKINPELTKFIPNELGKFYNHTDKVANVSNEIIGDGRYLRALKSIPANTELAADYREHSEMEQPEDFDKTKYASFDYDDTFTTPEGLAKAKELFNEGYNLFIISARDEITPEMVLRAQEAGIPRDNIIVTGSDEAKVAKVKALGIQKHFDNKSEVINQLGELGEQFRRGGFKSKKYTSNLLGKNRLFVKNGLLKKKSVKNKIYDPNSPYFEDGGYMDLDLDEEAIIKYKEGGYIVEELDNYTEGGEPDNGIITQEEIDAANTAMMKARLAYANEFGNPAAKRMINIPDNPYQFDNGDTGTHYMASMDNYAVPQIQDENGQLMLGDYGPDSREAMRFDSDEDANYFAEHYKDVSPGFINEKKEGGASGCPQGFYWNGKKCVKLLTRVYNNIEEFDKANQLMRDSTELFNLNAIGLKNLNNRLNIFRSDPRSPEFDIWGNKTGRNLNTLSSYTRRNISSSGVLTSPKWNNYTPYPATYINRNIKPIQRVADKIYSHSTRLGNMVFTPPWKKPFFEQNYYDVYRAPNTQPVYQEKPSVIKKFYPKIKDPVKDPVKDPIKNSVLPTTRTVYIDCPPGSVANGQTTKVTTDDPDSPGNYLTTITTGCDPIKEKEIIVPTEKPVINTEEVPMGTQGYPEELEGPNWEWDRKYHSFTTPRLNKHFPLGPLFNGKKKHTFSTPSLHRRKDYKEGGSIEMDLTREQINEYKKGGWIVEELDNYAEGGQPCPDGYTWDETKQDCVSLIDTNWLSNWYANRKLPLDEIPNKKYVNLMKERLPQYNPESTLLEELANLPPVEYQDVIDDDPNNQGQLTYDKKYNPDKILLKKSLLNDPVKLNQIYNSEASTAVDVNKPGLFAAQNMVIDPGLVLFEDRWGDLKGTDRDVAEDHYNYITDPEQDNIHSLVFEERVKRNLKSDQVITEADINKWKSEAEANGALDRNSPNFDDGLYTLFKLAKDNKSLMNWFNQLASNDKTKTGNKTKTVDEPQYAKQGGAMGYELGSIIEDEETKKYLESIGYTFEII